MTPIKEIEFERTYDASVETVWQAWTDPEILKKWWGPDNVFTPECKIDLRVGGKVYIVMEAGKAMGPYAGTRWPMDGTYTVVENNSKLAYNAKAWTEGQEETTTIDQVTELSLAEENGKTKLKLKAAINKIGPDAKMAVEGMQYGFTQQLAKLDKLLEK
jgi:uncharacterized protein YndB with AHSA1/START domain